MGNFRIAQLPFEDQSGKQINTQNEWNYARNQQRNWETIMQMISLRAQPTIVTYPAHNAESWEFVFEVESTGVYSDNGQIDNYGALLNECHGIPMISELGESTELIPQLITAGENQNIWFETVNNS